MRNDLFTNHYGFVVDYLAEALRDMRKHNFTEIIDRHFSMGAHLNARDRKAVRKTVSGLVKILFPHGEVPQGELAEILEFALEGRRRVKEQLKKMGSFEYYQTSFSYTLQETGEEKFVGVPEQGGRDLISTDPLSPGTVYTAGVTSDGTVGLYRLEVSVSSGGTGKLKMAGGISGAMKESVQRAFSYVLSKRAELGIARDLDVSDLHVEVIDLLGNRVEAEVGVALFVASYSAMRKAPVSPALLVLGDMSVQGNIKPLRSLTEPLQVAKDNGAKRALIPIENKRNFLDVSADIIEQVDPIFYGDPKTAAMKVLGNLQ
jgi:ATP-dependent Lon protease